MASIVKKKRKNGFSYYISYRTIDPSGKRKQHWYPCTSRKEATLLLDDVEIAEKENIIFLRDPKVTYPIAPVNKVGMTIEEMVYQYVDHCYSQGKWEARTSQIVKSCIRNYIVPYIGNVLIDQVTTRYLQEYYNILLTQKAAQGNHRSPPKSISPRTVKEVHKVLRPAFSLAKKWGQISINPAIDLELPRIKTFTRDQLSEKEIQDVLIKCDDAELALIIRTLCACTLRSGELAGMTWDCVDLSNDAIANERAYVFVTKEIARLYKDDLKNTKTDVYYTFPSSKPQSKTVLVLKRPKTEQSVRKVYLPKSLALALLEHREQQAAHINALGKEYHDYNLVFAQPNGLPYSGKILSSRFKNLLRDIGMREVDYYSLRHSGATAKLRNTHNIKSVQADMGHSTAKMLMDVYAGIIDEDRVINARVMEEILFSDKDKENK